MPRLSELKDITHHRLISGPSALLLRMPSGFDEESGTPRLILGTVAAKTRPHVKESVMRYVRWFDEIGANDVSTVGGKGANLGELTRAGLPVPPGFVVTADGYLDSMSAAGVRQLLAPAPTIGSGADATRDAAADAAKRRSIIEGTKLSDAVRIAVIEAYAKLCANAGETDVSVAVRSSATAEDGATTSFAGMHDSYTNVSGADAVCGRLLACWASTFDERAYTYRAVQGITAEPAIAVVVQRMVASERSGVMFTVDPATSDRSHLVIEGAFGLGEVVVGGAVEPDTYTVQREPLAVIAARIGIKTHEIVRGPDGADMRVDFDGEAGRRRVLDDVEVLAVAKLGLLAEVHYGCPQDLEWCFNAANELYLVQSRPITTLGDPSRVPQQAVSSAGTGAELVSGLGAAPGRASGRARVLSDPSEGAQLRAGEILVAPMTNPDWLPTVRRAAAVVTDEGGITCHAAIVSRELRIPCVVATRRATTTIHDGDLITVDGTRGVVTAGDSTSPTAAVRIRENQPDLAPAWPEAIATKLLVNIAMADHAEEVAALSVDGVGLLRAEFLVTEALGGRHPRAVMADGGSEEFVSKMADSLLRITRPFGTRPVVYRTIDFRSNEFSHLAGGEQFEPHEHNPMIGYRGCYRYVREPELFALELQMLARVREETPNVAIMIPFVRTLWELEACLELIDASPLGHQRGLKRWVMAEVPSVVYRIPEYAALGIDGMSIGSNDLTQLILGVDRDSEVCQELFDEEDAAVLDAIRAIIEGCHANGLTASLCGQAPSNKPGYAEHLVRFGIDSISVTPDSVSMTRAVLAAAERRVLMQFARRGTNLTTF